MALPESYSIELTDISNAQSVRTYSGVISDGIVQDEQANYIPFRFLTLADQTRYEFPMDRYLVKFSPERALIAEANRQQRLQAQRRSEDAEQPKIN
jgi:hypothetical protein